MPEEIPSQPSPAPDPEPNRISALPFRIWVLVRESTSARNLAPQNAIFRPQRSSPSFSGVAAVLLGIFAFVTRAKPQGNGSVDNIAAVEIPDQHAVMVAVNITLHNSGEKSLWIHDIKAKITTDGGELTDEAASAIDFDRYFQAFPALKEHAIAAIPPETKIPPGGQAQGTIVVSFPVTKDDFDKRKSLSVAIQPYDQPLPVVSDPR